MRGQGSKRELFSLAERQQGLFTARQAIGCGYDSRNHSYHVRRKNWARERRGIYRLGRFPRSPEADYVLWSLWSMDDSLNPQGVFSHETALQIHGVSDILPSKYHLSVSRDFGPRRIPKALILHRAELPDSDIEVRHGFRVTTPLRTLLDAEASETIAGEFVSQALISFLKDGRVSREATGQYPQLEPFLSQVDQHREAEPMYRFLKYHLTKAAPRQEISDDELRKMAQEVSAGLLKLFEFMGSTWRKAKETKKRKETVRFLSDGSRKDIVQELDQQINAQSDSNLRSLWKKFTRGFSPGRSV